MPTYTVKNKEGVTLKVTGESPPTKEQLDNIFTEYNQRQIQTSPTSTRQHEGRRGSIQASFECDD